MPSFDLDQNDAQYQILGFEPGKITINQEIYTENLIITPDQLITHWVPYSFDIILTLKPDVLLIGTGETLIFPPIELYGHLINHGIGVEIMNTAAACRTYNALSSEYRRVAAALILR
jgi:uncharacterized protein